MKLDVFAGDSVSVVFHRDNLLLSGAFLVMEPDVLHFLNLCTSSFLKKKLVDSLS